MKPITNILLLLALVCYVFLPLFEISHMGSLTGLEFSSSLITYQLGMKYSLYYAIPCRWFQLPQKPLLGNY